MLGELGDPSSGGTGESPSEGAGELLPEELVDEPSGGSGDFP